MSKTFGRSSGAMPMPESRIDIVTVASLRVAGKCGYQRVAEATYNGRSTLLYVRGDGH